MMSSYLQCGCDFCPSNFCPLPFVLILKVIYCSTRCNYNFQPVVQYNHLKMPFSNQHIVKSSKKRQNPKNCIDMTSSLLILTTFSEHVNCIGILIVTKIQLFCITRSKNMANFVFRCQLQESIGNLRLRSAQVPQFLIQRSSYGA